MRLVLDQLLARHPHWSLAAHGVFMPGIHLVSGDVGSGKSTLALMMAGLGVPEGGSVIREGIQSTMLSFQFPEFHVTGLSVADECESWGLIPEAVIQKAGIDVLPKAQALSLSRGSSNACTLPVSSPGITTCCCSMSHSHRSIARERSRSASRSAGDPAALR